MAKSTFLASLLVVFVTNSLLGQTPSGQVERWLNPAQPGVGIRVFALPPANIHRLKPSIEAPELSYLPLDVAPPTVPNQVLKKNRSHPVTEPIPLTLWLGEPSTVAMPRMEETGLVIQRASELPNITELPIQGSYLRDQASLAGLSWEASMMLILTPKVPERVNAVPFEPWNIPDPFHNAQTVRLRTPWPEMSSLPNFVAPPSGR